MKTIDEYKTRIMEIIDEGKSDGKDIIHIPTWKDESIEIIE